MLDHHHEGLAVHVYAVVEQRLKVGKAAKKEERLVEPHG
jgi:hypothetical protein